jgi:adenosylmethionine-8-amino-7-oxononanoate aminotransferase
MLASSLTESDIVVQCFAGLLDGLLYSPEACAMVKHPQGRVFYRKMAHEYPIVERGEGVYLWDAAGRKYLDASGGPLVVNVGHGVLPIAKALTDQASQVAYVHGNLFTTGILEAYS